ncbi:S-adenosyl-L-methionine-dependent methyltransferase [Choanephora cucurbitarum]|nr:S-adenosyl-L-methionine-dependent methyltransferase [Choanephora cucurbitarum]
MANREFAGSQYEPSEYDPEDQAWDDWSNDEEEQQDSQCLFCSNRFPQAKLTLDHVKQSHGFDYIHVRRSLHLNFYQSIRLINYIRQQVKANPQLSAIDMTFTGQEPFWKQDSYLQPVLEDDALLFALDELEDEPEQPVDLSRVEPSTELERQLLKLVQASREQTSNLEGQFEEYKSMVKRTFYEPLAQSDKGIEDPVSIANVADESNYYFNGYAQNEIHEQMLKDKARTEAYRDFAYENKDVFKDKVVLDVGCGTGILSMFAARAGAKQVFSVDNSAIIEKAKLNIKENGLDHIITCVRGKVEEIKLPVNKVDIIVSEWMGYFLLFEAMLDSVLVARDRWLAPNGIMAPSHTRILICALEDESLKNDRVHYWNDVYGFKMSAMKPNLEEALVDYIQPHSVMSDVVTIKDLYLQDITIKQLDFSNPFKITVKRDGQIHAFSGWFDTWFTRDGHAIPLEREAQKVEGEVYMTTSPFGEDTHWKQTTFILEESLDVKAGDQIEGVFTCHKGRENPRELECQIEYALNNGTKKTEHFTLHS